MPTYDLRNKKTGEIFTKRMSVAECDAYLKDNADVERYFTPDSCPTFRFIDSMGGRLKSMNGLNGECMADPKFEENVINRIKKTVRGNNLSERHKFSN